MFQKPLDVIELIGRVNMTRGDRLIAVSAARNAESAVEILFRASTKIRSALPLTSHARAQLAG